MALHSRCLGVEQRHAKLGLLIISNGTISIADPEPEGDSLGGPLIGSVWMHQAGLPSSGTTTRMSP